MTVRKEIIDRLKENKMSIREIALHYHITTEEVATDLMHIGKSIYPRQELRMEIPVCRTCGFQFKERAKLKPPSKCPKCRHEKITEPKFWIEEQKTR
jgi:predicted Zn-ribbon and HTH transcriptional regulator